MNADLRTLKNLSNQSEKDAKELLPINKDNSGCKHVIEPKKLIFSIVLSELGFIS